MWSESQFKYTHHIFVLECHFLKCNTGIVAKGWHKIVTRSDTHTPVKYKFRCKQDSPERLDALMVVWWECGDSMFWKLCLLTFKKHWSFLPLKLLVPIGEVSIMWSVLLPQEKGVNCFHTPREIFWITWKEMFFLTKLSHEWKI